jgi:hypothetical protein
MSTWACSGSPDGAQRPGPEHLAEHGGILQEQLALGGERVQVGAFGEPHRATLTLDRAPLGEHAADLLRVQRIPPCPLQQRRLGGRRQHRLAEQAGQQAGGVGSGQRRQRDRGRVGELAGPLGRAFVQLGPGGTHHQQRDPAGRPDQVAGEGEQGRVGPVQILQHEHERPPDGDRLQEAAPGREHRLPCDRLGAVHTDEADQQRKA